MATESGRGAYNQIEIYNKRLAKLAGNVGVKISDVTDQPEEVDVDTSGMTPYEKGRYEATLLLSNVREVCLDSAGGCTHTPRPRRSLQDTKTLDSLNQGQTRQRAAVSNRVRRNLRDAKVSMETLRKDAKKAGTLDDFAELEKHYKKTENMYAPQTPQRKRSVATLRTPSTGTSSVSGAPTPRLPRRRSV